MIQIRVSEDALQDLNDRLRFLRNAVAGPLRLLHDLYSSGY